MVKIKVVIGEENQEKKRGERKEGKNVGIGRKNDGITIN